jgi:RNA polymerase subunit RPABC4/transcription elongation factor Spt4
MCYMCDECGAIYDQEQFWCPWCGSQETDEVYEPYRIPIILIGYA